MNAATKSAWQTGHQQELNFWDGVVSGTSPHPEFSEEIRHRCDPQRGFDPWLLSHITTALPSDAKILDIAAGPVSSLGWHVGGVRLSITPIDVLADQYNKMLDEAGLTPPVRTLQIEAENLASSFKPNYFDLAHIRNALDHCHDPIAVIYETLIVLKPGAKLVVATNLNEGMRGFYQGMHQWNISVENDDTITLWNRNASYNLSEKFRCAILQYMPDNKDWLVFSIRK